MRITNNMMLRNAMSNINTNKVSVNTMETQMSTQKKIDRPSDDPVIALRALRLRSSLSEVNQYYENNIPDTESWLDSTEAALYNINQLLSDIRTQCTYGATDALTSDDRSSILSQIQELTSQLYSELNTDYAGRTVFTGYRTNQNVTFLTDDSEASYEITQDFSYASLEEYQYYGNLVTVPTTSAEVLDTDSLADPYEATFYRIRLGYDEIDGLYDADGNLVSDNGGTLDITYTYTDDDGNEQTGTIATTIYASYEDWEAACASGEYEIADGEAVFIRETGELILSDDAKDTISGNKASLSLDYKKTGFESGEVRPEYYYNCTNVTDENNPVTYTKFDEDGNEIYQDINYTVSANQTMTVNTQASDVLDSSLFRDVSELVEAVQAAVDAEQKVTDIEAMMALEEYSDDESQAALAVWLEAAEKEAAYAQDNLQNLFNDYIENCDDYMEQVNLAYTTVGSKGSSLDLIESRVSAQQTTIETLKSSNEDRDLSEIIIDYTAAYVAYEASLQAASKINQTTLLNYL